jgi:hypothetical protein
MNNPNLRYRDWKIPATQSSFIPESRVKILAYGDGGLTSSTGVKDISLISELKHALDNPTLGTPQVHNASANASQPTHTAAAAGSLPTIGHLYILEGTNPEFVEAFGAKFDIDPAFFSRHQRIALWEQRHEGGNTSKLASSDDPEHSFFMEYCELLYFESSPAESSLRNPKDMRHINVARKPSISTDLDRVGILHRKASFWSERKSDGTWNGMCVFFLLRARD